MNIACCRGRRGFPASFHHHCHVKTHVFPTLSLVAVQDRGKKSLRTVAFSRMLCIFKMKSDQIHWYFITNFAYSAVFLADLVLFVPVQRLRHMTHFRCQSNLFDRGHKKLRINWIFSWVHDNIITNNVVLSVLSWAHLVMRVQSQALLSILPMDCFVKVWSLFNQVTEPQKIWSY